MSDEAISLSVRGIAHLHLAQVQVSLGYALLAMTINYFHGFAPRNTSNGVNVSGLRIVLIKITAVTSFESS